MAQGAMDSWFGHNFQQARSDQSLSRVRLFATPWTPGLPVHHQLPEFTETHVHRVSDAIQPSHPLLSPSLPALNLSQQDRKSTRLNSSHSGQSRMPSSA